LIPISAEVIFVQIGPGFREGEVFIVHVISRGGGSVENFIWKSLGMTPVASSICILENTYIFLGCSHAGPCLLRLEETQTRIDLDERPSKVAKLDYNQTEAERHLSLAYTKLRLKSKFQTSYNVNLVDELPSFGPFSQISTFQPERIDDEDTHNWHGEKMITSCGFGGKSFTLVSSLKVPFDEIQDFELEEKDFKLDKIWTIGFPHSEDGDAGRLSHNYVLLSGNKGLTRVLQTTEDITELESTNCRLDCNTLDAGIIDGRLVQVTSEALYFHEVNGGVTFPKKLQKAALQGKFIAGIDFMGHPHLFQYEDHQMHDVKNLCLDLPHIPNYTHVFWYKELVIFIVQGSIYIFDPSTPGPAVFQSKRLDCAPCLITHGEHRYRSLTDVTTKSEKEPHLPDIIGEIIDIKICDLDVLDNGPTLVILILGRPMLLYRSYINSQRVQTAFPFSFQIQQHRFIESLSEGQIVPFRSHDLTGCYVMRGGIFPGLWLFASRNKIQVHRCSLGSNGSIIALAPFDSQCVGEEVTTASFFTLRRKKRVTEASIISIAKSAGGQRMDVRSFTYPVSRFDFTRTPTLSAMHPTLPILAIVFATTRAEIPMVVRSTNEDGENMEKPPVDEPLPQLPRGQKFFELEIHRMHANGTYERIGYTTFEPEEHVVCMDWTDNVSNIDAGLMLGTALCGGEDMACRGLFLLYSIDECRDPAEPLNPRGKVKCDKQQGIRGPVTAVGSYGDFVYFACGNRLTLHRYDDSQPHEERRIQMNAYYDIKFCITTVHRVKNYFFIGDIRKGMDLIRFLEDSYGMRKFDFMARSPSFPLSILNSGCIVEKGVLGLVATDHTGNCHLYQYQPHSDGREGDSVLMSCASFYMGGISKAIQVCGDKGKRNIIIGTDNGGLFTLVPTDDSTFRIVTTLCGILTQSLPFCGGLNPRSFRQPQETIFAVHGTTRKNIEDVTLLRSFYFTHSVIQESIADRMQMPLRKLLKTIEPCVTTFL